MIRKFVKEAQRIVIKVGSKVILEQDGKPNYPHMAHLVEQIATLKKANKEIIFVTSGAVGSGMEALSIKKRPKDLPTLQAAAAIGQMRLIRAYEDMFEKYGILVAQILLTHDDFNIRKRYLNIKNTINTLLSKGVIPIVNENDTVSVDEIKFGDNDVLASMVAMQMEAKVLVLLTTAQGFMVEKQDGTKEPLPQIFELNEEILKNIESHKEGLSLGGMKSKLEAAHNMIHVKGASVIASGKENGSLLKVFAGDNIGTLVAPTVVDSAPKMAGRKRWIAFYNRSKGKIIVDDGAIDALCHKNKSLLAVGIKSTENNFKKGDVVEIVSLSGQVMAKGICKLSSYLIDEVKGLNNDQILMLKFSEIIPKEIIHKDDLVILKK